MPREFPLTYVAADDRYGTMSYRRCGRSGLKLPAVSLGLWHNFGDGRGPEVNRAIPTRVVTGFRVDGDRLIRHRWAVSWTGRAWIAVDAAFGAVPAGGDLVGVAIHDADDAGLVAGEAALTHVRAAAWK